LKRKALLFDRMYIIAEDGNPELNTPHLTDRSKADLLYLQDQRFVIPLLPHISASLMARVGAFKEAQALIAFAESSEVETNHMPVYFALSDFMTRNLSAGITDFLGIDTVPIYRYGFSEIKVPIGSPLNDAVVLEVGMKALPVPDDSCAWEDILAFKSETEKTRWAFRRFLHALATKSRTEGEVRDEIEWTVNEYEESMRLHHLKASMSSVEVFVISTLDVIDGLIKCDWSKVAKGALSVKKRQVELLEAEMKAPGRECAYVFDTRKRFTQK
jgi:hypothetical protein